MLSHARYSGFAGRLSALAAVGVLLVGCGSSASSASPPASAAAPAASSAAPSKPSAAASASAKPAASAGSAAPSGASAAAAGQLPHVTLSYSALIGVNIPEWVADAAGIFKKNGLNVKVTYIASSEGIPALISGETQIANVGGSETLSAVAGGADLVTVTNDSPVYPFVLQVAPGIKSVADLKGKKVGVSNFGSVSDIALRVALEKKGLNPDTDVSIIAVGSASNRLAAMESGAIVGGVAFPPGSLKLESQGFHTLVDLSALKAPAAIGTGVLNRSYFNANHAVAQKYVDSVVEAIARARKDEPFVVNVLEKYFKSSDTKAMQSTYDYFVKNVIPALPYPKPEQYADSKAILGKKNAKVAAFDVAKMLDDPLVKSAADRGLDK